MVPVSLRIDSFFADYLNMADEKESNVAVGSTSDMETRGSQHEAGVELPPPYSQVPQYQEEHPQVIHNPTAQQQWAPQPGANVGLGGSQQPPFQFQQPGAFHPYNPGYPGPYLSGVGSEEDFRRRQQERAIQQGIANTVVVRRRFARRSCAYRLARFAVGLCLAGLILLIILGVLVVHPTLNDMKLKSAECRVISSEMTDVEKSCSCGRYCSSSYPCREIQVTFNARGKGHRAYLYEDVYDDKNKCSTQPCDDYEGNNYDSVSDFSDSYGQIGQTYTCFYNPKKLDEVFTTRSSVKSDEMKIMHCILWPMLIVAISVGILGTLFCRSKGYCCFRKSNGSSVPYQDLQPTA